MPGIPDANFGNSEHDFLYIPVVAADGTTWLNNLLGAKYNNIHSANFNPIQQGTSSDDYLAYGSLFQWGRPADGHELRTCTSGTECTSTYGSTTIRSSSIYPANNLFVYGWSDWKAGDTDGLERTAFLAKTDGTGICPTGYRLPTKTELEATRLAENITDSASYLSSVFKGVLGGSRYYIDALFDDIGTYEYLWYGDVSNINANALAVNSSSASWNYFSRSDGYSVRCLSED